MKNIFLAMSGLLFMTIACKTPRNGPNTGNIPETAKKKAFIPHAVGSFWVYETIQHLKNGSDESSIDTIKVVEHQQREDGLLVVLNQGKWVAKKNSDSIYVYCQGRGGGGFIMPLYQRSEQTSTYSTCMGDVMFEMTAKKLVNEVEVKGKSYKNCYEFSMNSEQKTIVADGIGVIKKMYYDGDRLMSEQVLLNYSVK